MANRRYSDRRFINAIEGSGAIVATIAERVGCAWETAKNAVTDEVNRPAVVAAYRSEEGRTNDLAKVVILRRIQAGDTQDAKWWLARKCPDEFGNRMDVTSGNAPITFTVKFEEMVTPETEE